MKGGLEMEEVRKMDVKKRNEVIERLFAVLAEDKNLTVVEMEDIANMFADFVRAAGDCLVADVKTEEFVERGWKVMQAHRLDRGPAKG